MILLWSSLLLALTIGYCSSLLLTVLSLPINGEAGDSDSNVTLKIIDLHLASAQVTSSTITSATAASYHPFQLSYIVDGDSYHLSGNATDGIDVKGFALNPNVDMNLQLSTSRTDTGEIVLLLPKMMIDNITSVKAAVSGKSVDAQIRQAFSNSTYSALQVAIPPGTHEVIITAAHVAPEFKSAATTTLLAGISSAGLISFLALFFRRKKCAYR
jgi:hypothetical protein